MRTLIGLLLAVGSPALAQDYQSQTRGNLLTCYEGAPTLDAKYDCFGSTVKACLKSTGLSEDDSVIPCADAETSAWLEVWSGEYDLTVQSIIASEGTADPCEPSTEECLQQLREMDEDVRASIESKCADESSGSNTAGNPALARVLCNLRENARRAIGLRALREEMGS